MRNRSHALLRSAISLFLLATVPAGVVGQATPVVQEGFVDAGGGVQLYYRLVGSGRDTLVVLHGGPGFSGDYFGHDLDALVSRGHALLFYDQRGAGRSTLVKDSAGLDGGRFAEDLEAVRRHFRFSRVTMLGHSWGAGVVALYAMRYPDRVGRVVVAGGIPLRLSLLVETLTRLNANRDSISSRRMEEWRQAQLANPEDPAACRAYYAIWFQPFFVDSAGAAARRLDVCTGSPEARRNKMLSVDRYVLASLGAYDWRPALRSVTAPTLILHGEGDVIRLESAREWAATLPNSRLLVLSGGGHFAYMEMPDKFLSAVDAFLNGGWPEGAVVVSGEK